jgi:hypothetical protein
VPPRTSRAGDGRFPSRSKTDLPTHVAGLRTRRPMVGVASDSDRTPLPGVERNRQPSLRSRTDSGLVALWRSLRISEGGMPLNLFTMMDSVMTRLLTGALWQVPARRASGGSRRSRWRSGVNRQRNCAPGGGGAACNLNWRTGLSLPISLLPKPQHTHTD